MPPHPYFFKHPEMQSNESNTNIHHNIPNMMPNMNNMNISQMMPFNPNYPPPFFPMGVSTEEQKKQIERISINNYNFSKI
jgi:hypothetical protein